MKMSKSQKLYKHQKKQSKKKDKTIKNKNGKLAKGLSRKSRPRHLSNYDRHSPVDYLKSRITKKKRSNLKECLNDNCPITMTNLNLSKRNPFSGKHGTVKLTCNHCFNKIGITNWIRKGNKTCPICRRAIDNSIIEKLVPSQEEYYDPLDNSNHSMEEEEYDPLAEAMFPNMFNHGRSSRSRSNSRSRSRSRSNSRASSRSYSDDEDEIQFDRALFRETQDSALRARENRYQR